jgi:hypothetical protein
LLADGVRIRDVLQLGLRLRVRAALEIEASGPDESENGASDLLPVFGEQAGEENGHGVTLTLARQEAREASISKYVIEWAGEKVGSVKKGIGAAAKRSKLEFVTPHVLRHSAAVWMAEGGRKMEEIAQYLGHSDSRITERVYAKYSPQHLREAANLLELDSISEIHAKRA